MDGTEAGGPDFVSGGRDYFAECCLSAILCAICITPSLAYLTLLLFRVRLRDYIVYRSELSRSLL